MKYLVPALVPFHLASFGPQAHGEALVFGQIGTQGRPAQVRGDVLLAVRHRRLPGRGGAKQLRQKPGLISTDVQMPAGLDLHASNSSPLALHARLEGRRRPGGSRRVLVRPQQDANVQTAPPARPGKDVTSSCKCSAIRPRSAGPPANGSMRAILSLKEFEGKIYVGSATATTRLLPPTPDPSTSGPRRREWDLPRKAGVRGA